MSDFLDISRITPETLEHLKQWEGRSETSIGKAWQQPVQGLAATLNRSNIEMIEKDEIPPLWHWLFFTPTARRSELSIDGHPHAGVFLPPVPLPLRMWAGGRLRWYGAIHVGDELKRVSTIKSVSHKQGHTGDLIFVTVLHRIESEGKLILEEEQDIVYRAPSPEIKPPKEPKRAPEKSDWSWEIDPDPILLFRYSALTFNSHRIHYDRAYAQCEEGYPGLLVQGPLLATLLVELASRETENRPVKSFRFTAIRPTYDLHPFKVCGVPSEDGKTAKLWTQDHDGYVTMQGEIEFS